MAKSSDEKETEYLKYLEKARSHQTPKPKLVAYQIHSEATVANDAELVLREHRRATFNLSTQGSWRQCRQTDACWVSVLECQA